MNLHACIRRCAGCRRSTSCAGSKPPGGRLSFTLAGGGALPHAVGAVAAGQGARGSARRAAVRAAASRARADRAGAAFHRTVTDKLRELRSPRRTPCRRRSATRADRLDDGVLRFVVAHSAPCPHSAPRIPRPDVYVSADDRMVDLAKGDVDVAIRYLAHPRAPRERDVPLRRALHAGREPRARQARPEDCQVPADLAHHVLLHFDDPDGRTPWINWSAWLAANGAAGPQAGGRDALLALRSGDPGGDRAGKAWRWGAYRSSPASSSAASSWRPSASATIRRAGYYAIPAPHAAAQPEVAGVRRVAGARNRRRSDGNASHVENDDARSFARAVAMDRAVRRACSDGRARARSRRGRRPPRAALRRARGARARRRPRRRFACEPRRRAGRRHARRSTSNATRGRSPGQTFDAIVVTNYLHRPLFRALCARRWRRTASCCTRPSRWATRPTAGRRIPISSCAATSSCRWPRWLPA